MTARDRTFRYCRSRGWPLWLCWLLAPTEFQRSSVSLAIYMKRRYPKARPPYYAEGEITSGSAYLGDDAPNRYDTAKLSDLAEGGSSDV